MHMSMINTLIRHYLMFAIKNLFVMEIILINSTLDYISIISNLFSISTKNSIINSLNL